MIEMNEMKKVLTIAGSDCSGGAGIQADIKTITAHKNVCNSAITALTAQNTTGVYGILDAGADFVGRQLDCIFQDIYPDAVKIGMVANKEIIEMIAHKLVEYKAKNIVADPVMVSTAGSRLMEEDAANTLIEKIIAISYSNYTKSSRSRSFMWLCYQDKRRLHKSSTDYFPKDTDCYFN